MSDEKKNAEIIERIKFLMKETGMRQKQLANRIGTDYSNLSKYLNARMPISDAFLNRMVVNLGVSKQWLAEGTGTPFGKGQEPAASDVQQQHDGESGGESGSVAVAPQGQGIPVYNIDATAGTLDPRTSQFDNEHIVGWVNLPNINPDCQIVRVSGDSMSPVICDGDYIAVRKVSNLQQIFWGQIYVVTLDDYRMVKYLRRHSDPRMVVLHSENPNYDDMDVLRTDIRGLLLVQHVMHVSTRL